MLPVGDIREKLLTQRRNLLRQVAQIEAELPWLEPDVESRVQEQGEEESLVQLVNRLRERIQAEIEVIDQASSSWRLRSTGGVSNADRTFLSPGWR
jgi:hypothetical protein